MFSDYLNIMSFSLHTSFHVLHRWKHCIRNCYLFFILTEKEVSFSTNETDYFSLLTFDRNILIGIRRMKIRKKSFPLNSNRLFHNFYRYKCHATKSQRWDCYWNKNWIWTERCKWM